MSETTKRREATKARLVAAGISEFARRGIDATSVEQVCDAAGFTRGAFYSNFETKDDLCIAITREISTAMAESLQTALAEMPETVEGPDMVEYLLAPRAPSPDVRTTQMELELRAHRDPAFGKRYREARVHLWPPYVELVQKASDRAGIEYVMNLQDLLFIYEAILYYPGGADDDPDRVTRLISALGSHLGREKR